MDDKIAIDATGLEKRFGETAALRGADLMLNKGELLVVSGPSGSGKSTLMLCMAGVVRPDVGDVRFNGTSIWGMKASERAMLRRRRFGLIFQFGQLIPELTAVENVLLPLLLDGINRREATPRALEQLASFGIEDLSRRRPCEMSGGQAQLVAVSRALVIMPDVLFADEPTGSLDSRAAHEVMAALRERTKNTGIATIVVTHDSEVAAYADRCVHVRDGVTCAAEIT